MTRPFVSLPAIALFIGLGGSASAQDKGIPGNPPPTTQSAPSESSHAPGHDVQTGKPETAEKETTGVGQKTTGETNRTQSTK